MKVHLHEIACLITAVHERFFIEMTERISFTGLFRVESLKVSTTHSCCLHSYLCFLVCFAFFRKKGCDESYPVKDDTFINNGLQDVTKKDPDGWDCQGVITM